jgi:hypothetical protein
MPWFEYWQNNSGGFYRDPARTLVIQAPDEETADRIAIDHGVYFNGVADGIDCDCCGDRWSPAWSCDGPEDVSDDDALFIITDIRALTQLNDGPIRIKLHRTPGG